MELSDLHPATRAVLNYFTWEHLPPHLRPPSEAIGKAAHELALTVPDGPEKTAGLRKLLEAKDCMVRAALVPTDVGRRE